MFQLNDRVRFIDEEKNKQYGIFLVFAIKGNYVTIGKGDYTSLGQDLITVEKIEIEIVK